MPERALRSTTVIFSFQLKRYQTQQRMGPAPLSTTSHHSSSTVNSGNLMRKGSMQLPGSPTKRYDGTFEFESAATSDFYYQVCNIADVGNLVS